MSRSKHQVNGKAQLYVVVSYAIHFHNDGINANSELTRTNFPTSNSQHQGQRSMMLKDAMLHNIMW